VTGASANRAMVEGVSTQIDQEKRASARAAAAMVESGMVLGLGTGTTVAFLVPALGERHLDITSVATSPATQSAAGAAGLKVVPFEGIDRLDLAIDGSDQVDPQGWLVKGGGGAHTREKIVAAAADRFVVIVSSNKVVDRLHPPVPLELMAFGLDVVRRVIPGIELRQAPLTPDGGVLADYHGEVDDPERLSALFDVTPGVVAHGLFPPPMVSAVLIGRGDQVEERQITA
jgi:ribose 5-phosphate isomerase A